MKNKKGQEVKKYTLKTKSGYLTYKVGTVYEVSKYAIKNQMLICK